MATRRRIVIIWGLGSFEEVRLYALTEESGVRFPNPKTEHARKEWAFLAPSALLLGTVLTLAGCGFGSTPSGQEDPEELPAAALATFEVLGETFTVLVENGQTVTDLYALQSGASNKSIPSGPLLAGPGPEDYNLPWSWHLDPKLTSMTNIVDGSCDAGRPASIEEDLAAWLAVGRYCPSDANLVALIAAPG